MQTEYLRRLANSGMTRGQIAEEIGTSIAETNRRLRRAGITTSGNRSHPKVEMVCERISAPPKRWMPSPEAVLMSSPWTMGECFFVQAGDRDRKAMKG